MGTISGLEYRKSICCIIIRYRLLQRKTWKKDLKKIVIFKIQLVSFPLVFAKHFICHPGLSPH